MKKVKIMKQYYKRLILLKLYSLFKKLAPFSNKFILFFEPFLPFFISLLLRRTLRNLKMKGTVNGYFLNIVRMSKLCYKVEVGFVLTMNQIGSIVLDLVNELLRSFSNE